MRLRQQRVQRIVVMMAAVALAGGIVASPRSARAQVPLSQWVIVPGEGWGPIRLGMTEQEVYAILGAPSSARGEKVRYVSFILSASNMVSMRFGEPRAADTHPPQLVDITVFDGPWRTPEGIRIGSLLPAVLKAYGDTMQPPLPGHALSCLDLQIIRSPEISPPVPPSLVLTYPRGVSFQVDLSTQKVDIISVVQAKVPPECF